MTDFVSCVTWIRRGIAKANPDKVQLSPQELREIVEAAKREADESVAEENAAPAAPPDPEDEYAFGNYDTEEDRTDMILGIGNLAVIEDDNGGDSDSSKEDEAIKNTDNLIIVGNSQKDWDILKVYVYNENDDDLYVHHDILLSACPLCTEWFRVADSNFIAVGQMAPEIEIWDLDVINPVEPVSKLGFHSEKKKHAHRNSGHRDAVLDLSWNPGFPHIMASGSVDKTAILWDLETHKDSTVIKNFAGNVESVAWHSQEGQTLLTASADSSVKVFDCRYEETFKSWSVEGEALIAKWDPCRPFLTTVGTSTGRLYGFDIRSADPLWSTEEHGKDVSGLAMAPTVQGLLISAHVDGIVKVWDVRSTTPTLVFTKEASIGQIHAFDLNPDAPYIGCVGGTKKSKNFKLMDFSKIKEIVEHFSTSA